MNRLLVIAFLLALCSFRQNHGVSQVSMDFTSRILENGKYLSVSGEVYFRKSDGLLTTRLTKPFENITVVNAAGEMRIYDPRANTVVLNRSALNSTESSYFWHFLNGTHNDLGLARNGYAIKSSRIDQGMIVTTWEPSPGYSTPIASVELVHEKSLPVFLAFRNNRRQLLGKIFFSAYRKVGNLQIPGTVTEISYKGKDSSVTSKKYSNFKMNGDVNAAFVNYRIPANAKVVTAQ